MNTIDLKGRKAVVTGGARGIGYAICQRLTESGAQCVIWDKDEEAAVEAAESLGNAVAVAVDVTQPDSVEQARAALSASSKM